MVTVTVATGFFLFREQLSRDVILPALGVFFAACGSSALNQVQEARYDRLMERTRRRPIPSGRIEPRWALFVAVLYLAIGFNLIANVDTHTGTLLLLTALSVLWYNGVYTYLKRVTAFAVVPGALVGALPPLIGWAAAGGVISDPTILELAFFLALWQIPHFWLLLLLYGEDYRRAGLPTVITLFSTRQIIHITFSWIVAVAAAGLLLAVTSGSTFPWNVLFLVASLWLVFGTGPLLLGKQPPERWPLRAFLRINLYALFVMVLLTGNAIAT
jgi:protoheme IX farnesyltransferase